MASASLAPLSRKNAFSRALELTVLRSDLLRSLYLAERAKTPTDAAEANSLYDKTRARVHALGFRTCFQRTRAGATDVLFIVRDA